MEILVSRQDLYEYRRQLGLLTLGFVPTMGALHAGHRSCIEAAAKENDRVLVSIFVNPKQFGPQEDFSKYPRTLKEDLLLCEQAGVDAVFIPHQSELYPIPFDSEIYLSRFDTFWCGEFRPGHLRGVATVVLILLNITRCHKAYFGEKDAQQLAMIKKMCFDLAHPTEIIAVPTLRDDHGLALSSRNRYLSEDELTQALVIPQALAQAAHAYLNGERSLEKLLIITQQHLATAPGFKLQYLGIRSLDGLFELVETIERDAVLALAGFQGTTRLIDNIILSESRQHELNDLITKAIPNHV